MYTRLSLARLPFALLLLAGSGLSALAQTPEAAAAPDGKALYRTKTCIACHGKDGAKAIQAIPDIAGQDKAYLLQQMNDIADGKRLSGPDERNYPRTQSMKDIMHLVNPTERSALADYLATLPPPKPRAPAAPLTPERLAAGKDAYTKGGCLTCHGLDGNKPMPTYPSLGGMKRDYLALQMKEMRDGIRTSGKAKLMLPFAKKLDDEKVALIADYLSQVERPVKTQ